MGRSSRTGCLDFSLRLPGCNVFMPLSPNQDVSSTIPDIRTGTNHFRRTLHNPFRNCNVGRRTRHRRHTFRRLLLQCRRIVHTMKPCRLCFARVADVSLCKTERCVDHSWKRCTPNPFPWRTFRFRKLDRQRLALLRTCRFPCNCRWNFRHHRKRHFRFQPITGFAVCHHFNGNVHRLVSSTLPTAGAPGTIRSNSNFRHCNRGNTVARCLSVCLRHRKT